MLWYNACSDYSVAVLLEIAYVFESRSESWISAPSISFLLLESHITNQRNIGSRKAFCVSKVTSSGAKYSLSNFFVLSTLSSLSIFAAWWRTFSSSCGSDREASTISSGLSSSTVLKCVLRDTVLAMHHQLLCSWSKQDLSFLFLE